MNPEQLLNQASLAIQKVNPTNSHMFIVGYTNKEIVCVPAYRAQALEIQFARYASSTIIQGLTTKQWDELSEKIANFYHQKGLL